MQNIDRVLEAIGEADPSELGSIFVAAIRQLGEHGREGREAIARSLEGGRDWKVEEGIAQLENLID